MVLSTWSFEYALLLQSAKTIFHYLRHPRNLLMPLIFPKSIFISQDHEIIYAVYLQCGIFIHLVYVVKDIVLILLINLI